MSLTLDFNSLLYHSTLISLNKHFVRPTPGFAEKASSKDICISSADSIVAIIRVFRAQHGLENSPVLLVYSAVVAGSGVLFTQDPATLALEKDRRLTFILKALVECSRTHNLAREARIKLQANIERRQSFAAESQEIDSTTQLAMDEYPDPTEMFYMNSVTGNMLGVDTLDLGAFNPLGSTTLGPAETDLFQGFANYATDPMLAQTWDSGESAIDLELSPSQIPDSVPGFSTQGYGSTGFNGRPHETDIL